AAWCSCPKYTSSRSGATLSNPSSGLASASTWISVAPPASRVDSTVMRSRQRGLVDRTPPHAAFQRADRFARLAGQAYLALRDDRHARAQFRHVFDDVG